MTTFASAPRNQAPPAAIRPAPREVARAAARKWLLPAVIAAGALPVLAVWWQGVTPMSLHDAGGSLTTAGRATGLLGAYLMLVLTALMARIPFVENRIGSDAAARVHRALGEYTVVLLAAHAVLITIGYAATSRTSVVSQAVTLEVDYPDVLMSTAALGLLIWIGVLSAKRVRRRLAYESWYLLHLYVYLAMALAFSHEFAVGTDFSQSLRNRVLWSAAHIAVAAAVITFRVALPLSRSLRHDVRVRSVVREAPGVVSIHLSGRDLDRLRAEPGQFLRWRFLSRGHWWQSHPYSLSAPPTSTRLRITVKGLGDASRDLADLRPGTRVWFEGPYGAFTARRRAAHRTLLIGAGAGITPLRTLFETLPGRGGDVILLYRATRPEDLALYREMERIARHRGFGLYPLVGPRDQAAGDPLAAPALLRLVPDLAARDVYLCGPPGMAAATTAALRTAGVPATRIHTEAFEL